MRREKQKNTKHTHSIFFSRGGLKTTRKNLERGVCACDNKKGEHFIFIPAVF